MLEKDLTPFNNQLTNLLNERLLGTGHLPDGRLRIEISSDSLNLEEKISLEQKIQLIASEHQIDDKLSVFFRRLNAGNSAPSSVATSAHRAPSGPRLPGAKIDRRAIPLVREIIVVASGKGGVGKSTVSAHLAVELAARGKKVALLDADIYGPSAPIMFGLSSGLTPRINEQQRMLPFESHGVAIMSFGFLSDTRNPVVWRGPLVAKAFEQLCYDVEWGERDYLIIDMPPGTGDIQLTMAEKLPISQAIIVSTPQDIALIDAHKALSMFEKLKVPILGLVENMSFHECSACGHQENIFGDHSENFARDRNVKILAKIPLRTAIRRACDEGLPLTLRDASSDEGLREIQMPYRQLADHLLDKTRIH